ncbi:MAG: hypothetical protein KDC88_13135, partial [Ignavibacteriae bacterium]|nr:hypothetical protein [Ignavibacteriota bacterium]
MPKLVWTEYNIKDEQSRQIFNENYHNHCKNVQIVTHQDKNAIEAYFMGIAFETTNIAHPTIDDRVIIDPLIHGGISMIEFRCMGTINQINSISNPYPECNTAKYPLLDDYIMWSAIGSNPIQAQFLVDHNELKDKIKYSGTRHNK